MIGLVETARTHVRAIHPHAPHLEETLRFVLELEPAADEALQLAALLHDIERAHPDPDSRFDSAVAFDDPAYQRYHQARSVRYAVVYLASEGAGPALLGDVAELIAVHEYGGFPAADILSCADALSFLRSMGPLVADWVRSGRTDVAGARGKLDLSFARLVLPTARSLGEPLYADAVAALESAVS